jgi:hypothetical protein
VIRIIVTVLAILFLVLGILYQGGFLKAFLPGGKDIPAPKSSLRPMTNSVVVAAPIPIKPPPPSPLAAAGLAADKTFPASAVVANATAEATAQKFTEARNLDRARRGAFVANR